MGDDDRRPNGPPATAGSQAIDSASPVRIEAMGDGRVGPSVRSDEPGREGLTFEEVQRREDAAIAERRARRGLGASKAAGDAAGAPTGLSLSGGGVRAACFSLGFLERLDAIESPRPAEPTRRGEGARPVCLEEFDYASGVSGGGYALGHFVTTMLPDSKVRLGDMTFSSKTVPAWLWGTGVFFLGMAFQLLKTGTLIVALLASLALVLRSLDAPDAMRFCSALGLDSDIARGFAPFWLTLWVFLAGYWIESTEVGRGWAWAWFRYSASVILSYMVNIWFLGGSYPENAGGFGFRFQFLHLAALVVPPLVLCVYLLTRQFPRIMSVVFAGIAAILTVLIYRQPHPYVEKVLLDHASLRWMDGYHWAGLLGSLCLVVAATVGGPSLWKADKGRRPPDLRTALLIPLLMGISCFAGLVTTGDVGIYTNSADPLQVEKAVETAQRYGELGSRLYWILLAALGLTSLGLFFPRRLFQSGRWIEADDRRRRRGGQSKGLTWVRGPVYRVIVFLCSYGVVLLAVFVVYSTVAAEDVSSYFTWRENMSVPAIHLGDFRDWDKAWRKIDHDAEAQDEGGDRKLAGALMNARRAAGFSLEEERRLSAEVRMQKAVHWQRRLLGVFIPVPMPAPWRHERAFAAADAAWPANYASAALEFNQRRTLEQGRRKVLDEVVKLLQNSAFFMNVDPPTRKATGPNGGSTMKQALVSWLDRVAVDRTDEERAEARAEAKQSERWRDLEEEYRVRAASLRSRDGGRDDPSYLADVSNTNRMALLLYLRDLMYDRRENVVFAGIVWAEDQWSRIWIAASAGLIWILCCVVNPNTFSLQKFYRHHVIDSWIEITKGAERRTDGPWLKEVDGAAGYRGGGDLDGDGGRGRRAPLPLFNATLEENRSLGHEPDLPNHIFTFSPIAAGYGTARNGEQQYWPMDDRHETGIARDNDLDLGNIVATSGAFLSPGTVANPALSALLHLLNVQTGYWAHPPGAMPRMTGVESLKFHFWQSLGVDVEGDGRFMLTDGAHVENLGLYTLLARRCRLIVAVDCSQEDRGQPKERRFNALLQVLQQAAGDGIQVGPFLNGYAFMEWKKNRRRIPQAGGIRGCDRKRAGGLDLLLPKGKDGDHPGDDVAQEHYLFAELIYPAPCEGVGLLVYARPTLTGDEGDALLLTGRSSAFPDDDPVDQFYTPAKMSEYRLLGRHVAEELANDPVFLAELVPAALASEREPSWQGDGHGRENGPSCAWCSRGGGDPCLWRRPRAFRGRAAGREAGPE